MGHIHTLSWEVGKQESDIAEGIGHNERRLAIKNVDVIDTQTRVALFNEFESKMPYPNFEFTELSYLCSCTTICQWCYSSLDIRQLTNLL